MGYNIDTLECIQKHKALRQSLKYDKAVHVCVGVGMHTHTDIYIYIWTHTETHTQYLYVYVYVQTYMHTCSLVAAGRNIDQSVCSQDSQVAFASWQRCGLWEGSYRGLNN